MNLRLNILRLLALPVLLLGVGFVLMGVGAGFAIGESGGLALLAGVAVGALMIALGCLFIARTIIFFRKPSLSVASDVLTLFSLYIFGSVSKTLEKLFPEGSDLAKKFGLHESFSFLAIGLVSLLVAWALYRVLKKLLLDGAFPPATAVKAEAAARK